MRAGTVYTPLRRRAEFTRVHTRGRRQGNALLQVRALAYPAPASFDSRIRLGLIVSKKFGNAVARNRFKRLVRAAIRQLAPVIAPGWDVLVLPREARQATMRDVAHALREAFAALGILETDDDAPGEGGAT